MMRFIFKTTETTGTTGKPQQCGLHRGTAAVVYVVIVVVILAFVFSRKTL